MRDRLFTLIEEGKKLKNRVSVSYFYEVRYGTGRRNYLHFLTDTYGEEVATILAHGASDGSSVFDYGAAFEILEELKKQHETAPSTGLSREEALQLHDKIFNS